MSASFYFKLTYKGRVILCETHQDFRYGLKTVSYFYHDIIPFIWDIDICFT